MPEILVKKFGGSSFHDPKGYLDVARHIKEERAHANGQVIVVSAPPGMTESWRTLLENVNASASDRIYGGLLPRADTVSAYILSAALEKLNIASRVFPADLLGIVTDEVFCNADPINIDLTRLKEALNANQVVIIPGGQALSLNGDLTWLGKNSSDMSAILIASKLRLSKCEIYSDVPGIFSADPNKIAHAVQLDRLSYEAALELSISGAKVLHHGAIKYASDHSVELVCRRNCLSFDQGSTIGLSGNVKAVVDDDRSKIFHFENKSELSSAQKVLSDQNIPFVCVFDNAAYTLAVTCGFSRPEHLFKEIGLPFHLGDQKLLSVLDMGEVRRHVCANLDELSKQARLFHDQLQFKNSKLVEEANV